QPLQLAATRLCFRRQEPHKQKPVGWQTRYGKRRNCRTGAGHRDYLETGIAHLPHQPVTRITDQRGSRIRNQGNALAFTQQPAQKSRAVCLVVIMHGDQPCRNLIGVQQLATVAGVLRSNQIHLFQYIQRPQRNVVEIPDGCCDNMQNTIRHECTIPMMIEFPRKLITVTTLTFAIALGACSTGGEHAGKQGPTIIDPLAEIQVMIERARKMPSPQAANALIDAANQLVAQGKRKQARRILEGMDTTGLPATTIADRGLALTRIAIEQQNLDQAIELLTTDSAGLLTAGSTLDSERLNQISILRAQVWEAQGSYLAA